MMNIKELEKNYIKKMTATILEIESEALEYTAQDFDNSYAVEKFAEKISEEVDFYINKMIDRNVNQNVIKQLQHLNFALWKRNVYLAKMVR